MSDTETQSIQDTQNQQKSSFKLSYVFSSDMKIYSSPTEAGKAYADADAEAGPIVTERRNNNLREIARFTRDGAETTKNPQDVSGISKNGNEQDALFWKAYHARIAEKPPQTKTVTRDVTNKETEPSKQKEPEQTQQEDNKAPTKDAAPIKGPIPESLPEGSAEPDKPQSEKSPDERFSTPISFEERFILTRDNNRQEMFRSYDDKRPAISDRGDSLHTKNADRSTAMDMIELAAHRGWSSMKVKGPEEFRREMWIEGTAQGIEVKGYRPNDKDRAEAERRAELIGERVIERLDKAHGKETGAQHSNTAARSDIQAGEKSNVVPMINYKDGLTGKITDIGTAPYRNREGASPTPYVSMTLEDGRPHTLWGVALPDMLNRNQLKVGDKATISDEGKRAVTVQERDPKTGVIRDKETFRREWGARDIERAPEGKRVVPNQKNDEPIVESNHPTTNRNEASNLSQKTDANDTLHREQKHTADTLEGKLQRNDAVKDPNLRGAASILAKIDAEMRAAGVPEKDRHIVRDYAASELAKGIQAGHKYDVQKLPNVTPEQQAAAKAITKKDVSAIIERSTAQKSLNLSAGNKTATQTPEQSRERSQQAERGRER